MIGEGLAKNPFSAARFAPGVVPWLSDRPRHLELLADRALAPGARHQVVGVHGSGKSTLLAHLERMARLRGRAAVRFRGSRGLPLGQVLGRAGGPALVVLVDEAQELGAPRFALLAAAARLLGGSLVASTHADLGLPTLIHARVDAALAARVVGHLAPELPSPADLEGRLRRHSGNLREVLFELYDEAERAPRGPQGIARAQRNPIDP